MNTSSELTKLLSRNTCTVRVTKNEHRGDYLTTREYLTTSEDVFEIIENDAPVEEMIQRDTVIEIQVYPRTPIGFFRVMHFDLEEAARLMNTYLDEEEK